MDDHDAHEPGWARRTSTAAAIANRLPGGWVIGDAGKLIRTVYEEGSCFTKLDFWNCIALSRVSAGLAVDIPDRGLFIVMLRVGGQCDRVRRSAVILDARRVAQG